MSDFKCTVERIRIKPHPNADQIELALVGDFQCIVRKGDFRDGDLAVYIPEQAIVPDWLLEKMGLMGKLSGSGKNRVRALKLRGVLSQGLVLKGDEGGDNNHIFLDNGVFAEGNSVGSTVFKEGDDAAKWLGIIKYEPKLPAHMMGRVCGIEWAATIKYDFDNIKKTPDMFKDGEEVIFTEKIHGTLLLVGVVPERLANEKYHAGRVIVSSKGMAAKGWVLDHTDESCLHVRAAKQFGLLDKILDLRKFADQDDAPHFIIGEIFGPGVQDLSYGDNLEFRLFDVAMGERDNLVFASQATLERFSSRWSIKTVPVLYRGPFSKEILEHYTNGPETISGTARHIREGVVVRTPDHEVDHMSRRKIAKSVSEAYLLRKGEVTEFA